MQKLILNESLFDSKKPLKEEFSPSMPKWLQAKILVDLRHRELVKKPNKMMKYADNDVPVLTTHNTRWSNGVQNISTVTEQLLNKYNIDLSKARFIEGEIPTKPSDPRITLPNIGFYHIRTDEGYAVYSPGLNDEQACGITQLGDKFFKYIPKKTLSQYADAFCYLDTSESTNLMTDKKLARTELANEMNQLPDYDRHDYFNKEKGIWQSPHQTRYKIDSDSLSARRKLKQQLIDKSGYLIDPKKYTKILLAQGKNIWAKQVEDIYNDLVKIKTNLSTNFDLTEPGSYFNEYEFRNMITKYSTACSYYRTLLEVIDQIQVNNNPDELNYVYDNIKNQLDSTKLYISDILAQQSGIGINYDSVDW